MFKLDLKIITLQNFKEPDGPAAFHPTAEEWLRVISTPKLNRGVPKSVKKLFEVARAGLAYGWFHEGVLSLGTDQLLRVCELAARRRAVQVGIPIDRIPKRKDKLIRDRFFSEIVDDLAKNGIIPLNEHSQWKTLVNWRNTVAHPKTHTRASLNCSASHLQSVCNSINNLFAPSLAAKQNSKRLNSKTQKVSTV